MSTTDNANRASEGPLALEVAAAQEAERAEARLRLALGGRIREARQRRDLSARRLAQLAGVTPSWISQLERGQVTPSFATMFRINHLLGITTGDLFDTVPSTGRVLLREDWRVHSFRGISDDAVLAVDPEQRVEVLWSQIPVGVTGHEPVTHKADVHFVFTLRGTVQLRIGNDIHVLPPYASILFDGRIPHEWANLSNEPAEILSIFAPAV
jgi:transcriptional regulator with XRE-family HTH domain